MDNTPLRLLLVEDNPNDADLMLRRLRNAGFALEYERVDTEADYRKKLNPELDMIVSDFALPQFTGLQALQLLKESKLDIPFILVSGTIGEETAVAAMRAGAADYLLKDRLTRLGEAARQALAKNSLRRQREQAEEAMLQSEHRYRHLFESLTEAAFLIDTRSRRLLDVNLSAEKLLGRSRSEILGANESLLFPPGKAADYCARLAGIHRNGRTNFEEAEILTKEGKSICVRVSLSPIQFHGRDLLLALMADMTSEQRAEATIRKLKHRSDLILNSAGEGIYGVDLEGNINFANPKAAELLGWKVEDLLGKPAHATIQHSRSDGGKLPVEESPILESLIGGFPKRVTNGIFWRRDGKSFRVDYVCAPVKDETGQTTGAIVTFKDATEQFMAEARLKLQEQKYRLLFEINPSPMWVFDTKSLAILAVNDAAVTQYGYSREEFLKLSIKDLRPAEDVAELLEARANSSEQAGAHYSGQFRHQKKDGSVIFVEIYSAPITWEDIRGRIVSAVDVTERKQAEEQLRAQAEIISRAHDAIIFRNFDDQRITFWNQGAEQLYGWTAQEAVGQKISDLLYPDSEAYREAVKVMTATGEFKGELKQCTKDKRQVVCDVRAMLVRSDDGTPRGVLAINTDITEKKKLENQLLRAQRLESIGTLASGVAHDLNNVLTPILIAAESVRRSGDERTASTMQLIEESARRGASIVKQVLTFARGVQGERVIIKPTHLIEEMADIARKTFPKSIEIETKYPEEVWSIEGDPTQLHQVLLNLSVNARDAMPNGGSLVLAVENFEIDENYAAMIPGAKVGPHLLLRVSDTGSGMPRTVVEKIFDPFFTTKETGQGTGLGLSTALGIVKSHQGIISVYSEPGQGTTFKIFLPAIRQTSKTETIDAPVENLNGNGEVVLVVDDEATVLRVTEMILTQRNYQVVSAPEAPEAIAILAQRQNDIQLVLTDLMLPHMDGVSLIRAMKKIKPNLVFIASTGQGEQARLSELQSLGVKHFLSKPYDTRNLLETVNAALHQPK